MWNSTLLIGLTIAAFVLVSFANADEPPDVNPAATPVDSAFFASYSEMFESGFTGAGTRLNDARRHYEAARRERPDDPHVEYGFAIVLLKNFQQEEALDHLESVIEANAAYLPAWRIQFRELLRDRDYEEAIRLLCTEICAQGGYRVDADAIACGLSAMSEGLWLDLLISPRRLSRDDARRMCMVHLAAAFPRHFGPPGDPRPLQQDIAPDKVMKEAR